MDTIKNAIGFLLLYLPVTALIAIVIAAVLMIKWKIKKAGLKILLTAAVSICVIYFLFPFTKGPHATFTWKHIAKAETISEEDVDSAMEACKKYFCDRENFQYCWLQELKFEENEYNYKKNSDNKEILIIESKIKSGIKSSAAYDGKHFTVERGQGENWTVKSIGGG
ncbi:hypothetical protein [Ruminococcus flavefaciens]|uniref:hypothetical protein n=1 Tax=Ruminococcus flavefaciens TaxID=1265 RepID=UPI000491AB5E|nr:hypothetical protein [Ruminococcus flavefaciens]